MTKITRDNKFDTLKGILIYFVVLGHFFSNKVFLKEECPASYIELINTLIYSFHMPAFVFVSGYFSKTKSSNDFIYKTVSSVLMPFLACNTLLWLLLSGKLNELFFPQYAMWYLLSLFFWRLLIIPCSKIKGILIWSFLFALYIGMTPADNFLSLSKTITFFPYFLAGYYLNDESIGRIRKIPKAFSGAAIFLSLAATVYLYNRGLPLRTMQKMDRPYSEFDFSLMENVVFRGSIFIIGFMIIFGLLAFVPEKENFFTKLGSGSITIYLAHVFIIRGLDRLFVSNRFAGELPYIFISIVLSAIICYVCSRECVLKLYRKVMEKMCGIILCNK